MEDGVFSQKGLVCTVIRDKVNINGPDSRKVRAWLARQKDNIEIFYLPAYAPEYNPDEYLNNDLKQQIKNKPRPDSREELVSMTASIPNSIQKQPVRVKSYFRAKHMRYAA